MAIGWKTTTSPWSSPRISIRSWSRRSSRLGLGVSPDDAIRRNYTTSVHPERRPRDEHPVVGRFELLVGLPPVGLGHVSEDGNLARLFVELQHRQDLEAIHVIDAYAQDDEI